MKPCLIFDLDGTLLDTSIELAASLNHALESIGRPPIETHGVKALVAQFDEPDRPYLSRTAPQFLKARMSDYDHLARTEAHAQLVLSSFKAKADEAKAKKEADKKAKADTKAKADDEKKLKARLISGAGHPVIGSYDDAVEQLQEARFGETVATSRQSAAA
mgnify:CR=1 FL=1